MKIKVSDAGKKGLGIFAAKKIRKGQIIEICPVLILPKNDWGAIESTLLSNYVFDWGRGRCAIALGTGCLYNHSEYPNAEVEWIVGETTLQYIAARTIRKDEEICINYGYKPTGYTPMLDSGLEART